MAEDIQHLLGRGAGRIRAARRRTRQEPPATERPAGSDAWRVPSPPLPPPQAAERSRARGIAPVGSVVVPAASRSLGPRGNRSTRADRFPDWAADYNGTTATAKPTLASRRRDWEALPGKTRHASRADDAAARSHFSGRIREQRRIGKRLDGDAAFASQSPREVFYSASAADSSSKCVVSSSVSVVSSDGQLSSTRKRCCPRLRAGLDLVDDLAPHLDRGNGPHDDHARLEVP